MVSIVNVVVPGVDGDTAKLALPKPPLPLSVEAPTVKLTVPVYPPVEVTVMVEVPLLPGFGDDIVMAVADSVMSGLVTVMVVVPEEAAYVESPPYAAVIVSVPAVKPSVGVAELTDRVAVPTPLAPGVMFAVPTVVVPA
jgi:hypothetical protein